MLLRIAGLFRPLSNPVVDCDVSVQRKFFVSAGAILLVRHRFGPFRPLHHSALLKNRGDLSIREDTREVIYGQATGPPTLPRRIAAEAGLCGVRPTAALSGPNKNEMPR
jgi:hypothetical protein